MTASGRVAGSGAAAPETSSERPPNRLARLWASREDLTGALALAAIVLLCRPYFGIRHDARIYIGRAEADLGRAGMAQDLMFSHDGQTGFSAFGALLRPAVASLGSPGAAILFTAVGLLLWFAAAAFLFSRFLKGARLWAALTALAALSPVFGGFGVFSFAEGFVTPRLFAEAAALGSLAFMAQRMPLAAILLLLVSGALHPIMAAPVAGVGLTLLVIDDRRWLIAAGAGLVLGLAAAFAGLPLAGRLVILLDPAWRHVLEIRSSYLFPALWPLASWWTLARQAATLLIAVRYLAVGPRRLVWSAMLVGGVGLALSAAAPMLLIIQLQTWRALWIPAVLAAALAPLCAIRLWQEGALGRVAAAALAVAWCAIGLGWATAAAAMAAAALAYAPKTLSAPRLVWLAASGLAGVALARTLVVDVAAAAQFVIDEGWNAPPVRLLAADLLAILVGAIAVVTLARPAAARKLARVPAVLAAAALVAAFAAFVWDAQYDWFRAREEQRNAQALRAVLPPGPVVWLAGDGRAGPWTDRPEWWSEIQGAGSVFDRPLAMEWERRYQVLVRAGVVSPRTRFMENLARRGPDVTPAALILICRAQPAPAAVVAPAERVPAASLPLARARWSAGAKPPGGFERTDFLVFVCPVGRLASAAGPATNGAVAPRASIPAGSPASS